MARYKLKADAYIVDNIVKAGTEVGDGTPHPIKDEPGANLIPIDADAKARVKQAQAARAARSSKADAGASAADAARLRGAEETIEELERVNARLTKQLTDANEANTKLTEDLDRAQTSLETTLRDLADANAKLPPGDGDAAGGKGKKSSG
jgi:hypothetical protein